MRDRLKITVPDEVRRNPGGAVDKRNDLAIDRALDLQARDAGLLLRLSLVGAAEDRSHSVFLGRRHISRPAFQGEEFHRALLPRLAAPPAEIGEPMRLR